MRPPPPQGGALIQLSYNLIQLLNTGSVLNSKAVYRKRQELNLPTPYGSDGLAIRCITALPRFQLQTGNSSSFIRSERDSNPRTREDQRFSRPPQYDRFGIAPKDMFIIY